jgi:hypothetical protein
LADAKIDHLNSEPPFNESDEELMMLAYDLLNTPSAYVAQVAVQKTGAASTLVRERAVGSCLVVPNYKGAVINLYNAMTSEAVVQNYFYTFDGKKRIDTRTQKSHL